MKKIISFFLGLISFIAGWWLLYLGAHNRSIPNPLLTFQKIAELKGVLMLHLGASLLRVLIALLLALVIGFPLGILLSRQKKVNTFLSPFLYFLYPLPKVAFLPIFMMFFGLGNFSKVLLLFTIIVLQVVISIRDACNLIPADYYRVMKSFNSTKWQTLRFLTIPAILPQLFASLRVSIAISLASLFFAENYAVTYGLGYFIMSGWTKMDYAEMFAGILVIALLGFILFTLIDLLEEIALKYKKSAV